MTAVGDWTYQRIVGLLADSSWEGLLIDFKEGFNDGGVPERSNSIHKTAIGFANADGGHLIFGVRDPANNAGLSVEELIVGIDRRVDVPREFQQLLATAQPAVLIEPYPARIDIPHAPDRMLAVMHIPRTKVGAHRASDGRFMIRRSGSANEPMTYLEVRNAMISTLERDGRVRILNSYLSSVYETAHSMLEMGNGVWNAPDRFDVQTIDRLGVDACQLLDDGSRLFERLIYITKHCQRVNLRLANLTLWKQSSVPLEVTKSSLREIDRLVPEFRTELMRSIGEEVNGAN